jgi:porphobilinogen deaminase
MQKIRIVIPTSFQWLTDTAGKEAEKLALDFSIQTDDNPFRLIAHDEADVCFMPLREVPFSLPVGIVITALRKRQDPENILMVRQDLADESKLLSLPDSAKVFVHNQVIARCFADYFPSADIHLKQVHETAPEFAILPKCDAYLQNPAIQDYLIHELHPDEFTPAAGQGVFAWICREDHTMLRRTLLKIHCSETARQCNVERRIVRKWQQEEISGNAFCSVHPSGHYQLNLIKLNSAGETEREKRSSTVLSEWNNVG